LQRALWMLQLLAFPLVGDLARDHEGVPKTNREAHFNHELDTEILPRHRGNAEGKWQEIGREGPRKGGICQGTERKGEPAKKAPDPPQGGPEDQPYFRVPSIPWVAWQPYPPPLGRLRAHSFASPPHDGFAIVEDSGNCLRATEVLTKSANLLRTP